MPVAADPPSSAFAVCWQIANRVAAAESLFRQVIDNELSAARDFLFEASRKFLPAYLIFASGGVRARVIHQLLDASRATPPRNKQARADERHLLLYLQRVAAKNDSLSEFGPEGWGTVGNETEKLALSPGPGIARRETFLERWTAHGVAAAINADPETAAELAPRLHPNGRLEQDRFVFTETGASVALDPATRFLYSATNPIGEECFRECHFSISEELINEVAIDAAPWIDLWRDNYAFVASRVAAGLRALLEQAPPQNGTLPLPAFLRHCAQLQMPLTGPGLIVLAHNAFQEVKTAFVENLCQHADKAEYELSVADCHFVRREFEYESFDEYTYPSADLQLGAESVGAICRDEYQWVLAELHPPVALLHHGFFWSCPNREALTHALAKTVGVRPNFHFGFSSADFTATTTVRLFDGLPDCTAFVAAQRGNPKWRIIPPAEIEVFLHEQSGDVRLRLRATHEDLGSFARAWTIPLGFHPFSFSLGAHTPRLRCGKIVVQRETWTVALEELGAGDFTGISCDLVTAIERLRAARQLPRHVYIRPSEQALRRSGAEGRDKDTKPVYIDLESYLFLEIFHRWLTKAGELEITEMLPTPDQLLWREPDGRRTFELRTQIIPR